MWFNAQKNTLFVTILDRREAHCASRAAAIGLSTLPETLVMTELSNLSPPPPSGVNRLIDKLPWREHAIIMAQCETVDLTFGQVLCEAEKPFQHVYFPITGVISLVKVLNEHQSLETEQMGNEGMLGVTLVLGVNFAPQHCVVQASGTALRLNADKLLNILSTCPAATRIFHRYLYLTMLQLTQTATCSRFHDVAARLARALLMTHDRAHSNHFSLTHQFLADMLGVQRGGVTIAAGRLQRKKIIRYSRGNIYILDRGALEAASCDCYSTVVDDYARLLP